MVLNLAAAAVVALIVCLALIRLLRPALVRYALARPNARSGHRTPTPQGGGIAIIGALVVGVASAAALAPAAAMAGTADALLLLAVAVVGIGLVGGIDDIRPLPVVPRLATQAIAVALALYAAGDGLRLLPALPYGLERGLELLAGLWFVNLTNFMDGLDLMTVAEAAPLAASLTVFAWFGWLAPPAGLVAAALFGALVGFTPHNWPVARLFLGDVGSLAIGLVLAWLLYGLAGNGSVAAAVLLPMYYCLDATVTLVRRLKRRERVWEAHRFHFYQQAVDGGMGPLTVAGHVLALNLVLVGLAAVSLAVDDVTAQIALVACGAAATGAVLARFRSSPTRGNALSH